MTLSLVQVLKLVPPSMFLFCHSKSDLTGHDVGFSLQRQTLNKELI